MLLAKQNWIDEISKQLPDTVEGIHDLPLVEEDEKVEIRFSFHNLTVDENVVVLLVGICPGFRQAKLSIQLYQEYPDLNQVKKKARFVGQTKIKLLDMLVELDLGDMDMLEKDGFIDSIALIPFPVFVNGKNYSGHSPSLKEPLLQQYICQYFVPAISQMKNLKLMIPLGKAVREELHRLQKEEAIDPNIVILDHFPHPSGLNATGPQQFAKYKEEMKEIIHTLGIDREN